MPTLKIENKIENLAAIEQFIEHFGDGNNLSSEVIFDLNLILDELVTNIINYGFIDKEVHFIEISIEKIENEITIEIADDGIAFNPLEKKEVDIKSPLEERAIGGLGIFFVKQKTDAMIYKRENGKNLLKLIKKINKEI